MPGRGAERAELARAAGAHHLVNYRTPSAADEILRTAPDGADVAAVADVVAAAVDGDLAVGADAGLPVHKVPLRQTADAHDAVEGGAVGRVLIDVA